MTPLALDLRFALRSLARRPGLTLAVVFSLGLGIGANTAIFSLMHQMLLRALPVQDPDRLVLLNSPPDFKSGRQSSNNAGGMEAIFSYPMFRALEKNPAGLAGLAAYRLFGANLAFEGKTQSGSVLTVSGGYFPLLGVQPVFGRTLAPADDQGAGQPAAVLSFGYWRDRLGGSTEILNQPLRVNGQVFTVVGVAPANFLGLTIGDEPDVYVPLVFKPAMTPGWDGTDRWNDYYLYVFGRLLPGATVAQAQDALNGTYAGLVAEQAKTVRGRDQDYLQRFRDSRLSLHPGAHGQSRLRDQMRTPLIILIICTGLVLLIAAANAANLLLARAAQRARELSIRSALGAGRRQIMNQLLTEALVLSAGGGVAGLILGQWVLDLLISTLSTGDDPGYFLSARLDPIVLGFTIGIALLTGLLFGLYPAWSAARDSAAATLKEDSGNASASRAGVRARTALVTAQIAISLLLLIPMGLFLKSLVNLVRVDLGLRTTNVLTFGISPELNGYTTERYRQLFERADLELAAIPGVESVTTAMVPLVAGNNWGNSLNVEGFPSGPDADNHSMFNVVGPGFFSAMGVALVSGREFTASDTAAAPQAAIVNQTWANHFFPNQNPIGRKFSVSGETPSITIVGVVTDTKYSSVRDKAPRLYFRSYRQDPGPGPMSFYVRAALPPDQIAPQLRRVMASLDPDLPLRNFRTLDDQVRLNIRSDRLVLQLASSFAVLATILAMLGLYGVMAFGVARRTREIGIRMALGAGAARIRSLVLRDVAMILAIGAAAGIPAALALARLAEAQLFGVKANDPAVVLAAVAALAVASLLAGYLPARRATRINPVDALRYE